MAHYAYPFQELAETVQGKTLQFAQPEAKISRLLIDSRKIVEPKNSLFFALTGQRNDGHDYILTAYQAGVRNFVVSKKISLSKLKHANIILVDNTLRALQHIAKAHRKRFKLPVIGITGSNGKTTVKEWLYQLLQEDYNIVRSPKSYNSQVGVPLSVWELKSSNDLAIFEAGISQVKEMKFLAPIIECNIGLFTHLGTAHDAGFQDQEEKVREKSQLFKYAEVLIYSLDQPLVKKVLSKFSKQHFTWSTQDPSARLFIENIQSQNGYTELSAQYKSKTIQLRIPFIDQAAIKNTIHCWAVLLYLGYSTKLIQKRIAKLQRVAMRLELKAAIHNCVLINDSYNLDLVSLEIALDFMIQQGQREKRTLILSDILQSGLSGDDLYKAVARLVVEKGINRLIGVGEAIEHIKTKLPSSVEFTQYKNTALLLAQLSKISFQNEAILLKGARVFAFERIANRLEQQAHRTVLEVNLNALINNLNVYAKLLKPKTKIMVMVKAAAYGSGAIEVARLLAFHKIDYLGVAYADEGVALRQAGIQLPIMVLNPEKTSFDNLLQYQLEPEIYSLKQFEEYLEFAPAHQLAPIHLKLETGMNRLGFALSDLKMLIHYLKANPDLKIRSIFSHLVASDSPDHDDFSLEQIKSFHSGYRRICKALNYRPLSHILNSGGILRFPQHQMDMVRLGVGLYGIQPNNKIADQIEVVNTLKASISQIKELPAQTTVGYNRSGKVNRDSRIATISIGYADGLPRSAGNGNYHVNILGRLAPTIGNICMDMCMIDVTDIPEAQEGDEVLIFGQHPSVEELASSCGTIPYEIFTNISERVKRVYFQE